MNLKSSQAGFTLLEVIISMAIMVFISFSIYQATVETFRLRDSLSKEGDFYNSILLATNILQRDISMIYSPFAVLPPNAKIDPGSGLPEFLGISGTDGEFRDLTVASTFWGGAMDPSGLRPSRFIGSETKISFVSLSHLRMYKDKPESDFAKITYEAKRDEKNTEHPGSLVLVKTESTNAFAIDDTLNPANRNYELLPGIRKISYSYLQQQGQTWKTFRSWDSNNEDTKLKLPDIIIMSLEVEGPKRQTFEGIFKFRPEIPINAIPKTF